MSDYRDEAVARLDVLAFMAQEGVELHRLNDREYRFLCPFHEDRDPSANINIETKLWFCHACGAKGSPIDWLMQRGGRTYRDALTELGERVGMAPPSLARGHADMPGRGDAPSQKAAAGLAKLTEENVTRWHEVALRNPDLMRWFHEHRGYTDETIAAWQLGWDGFRVTIPIRDATGKLVNVRRYKRDATGQAGKMIGIAEGMNEARLFPLSALDHDEVVLAEGEWDAILLQQNGWPNALTVTSGAGIWNADFTPLFAGKRVAICYDNDDAGHKGSAKVARILTTNPAVEVAIVTIPGLPEKGDVTDFFVEQGRSAEELQTLIREAIPYVVAESRIDKRPPVAAALDEASDNRRYSGVKTQIAVLVSGKTTTPYGVPMSFVATCPMSNKRYCGICPMLESGGRNEVHIAASDPQVLALVNVTDQQKRAAMKALAGAVAPCNLVRFEDEKAGNIEEVRLIPEIDTRADQGDHEYASRTGYFMGHGLRANLGYTITGYAHQHPKNQQMVHLIAEAVPAQDSISAFAMTPELKEQLSIFNTAPGESVESKLASIYDDFSRNVHRIHGRPDMQLAYDLVWHSAIAFYFDGNFVRRGWVECMVIGDSGQGKTEMAIGLLGHYRLGQRIQGEQTTTAGILGGLSQMGDAWILGWGKLPLNDRRLVIVDETQGMHPEAIEGLSDVRATGVAEITKIRTEQTNARCRIIWLANPRGGRPLAQHNHGVTAISELFTKPEDVRRLDFALAAASGEVPLHQINTLYGAKGEPRYGSDLCRNLVLWAWSRRPDQVTFEPKAMSAILQTATTMAGKFSAAIPLVEPADQRLKLARLSAALAARLFSCDETGEVLVVKPEHVAHVGAFLDRIYTSPGMAYDEYSIDQFKGNQMDERAEDEARHRIISWPNSDTAIAWLREARIFSRRDMEDATGWDVETAKAELAWLLSSHLVRGVKQGYVKNPILIALLRRMTTGDSTAEALVRQVLGEAPF